MALIAKILCTAVAPHMNTKISVLRCASNSYKLGSRFGSGSCSSSGGKDDKVHIMDPSSDNPGAPTIYDCRKLGHNLPTKDVCPNFETLPNIPSGVFRNTEGEVLGCAAGKCFFYSYKNPEYFSYHHMSFYDLNDGLRQYRKASPKSGRKPP